MPEPGHVPPLAVLQRAWPHCVKGLGSENLQPLEGTSESRRWVWGNGRTRLVLTEGRQGDMAGSWAAMGAAGRAGLRVPRIVPSPSGSALYVASRPVEFSGPGQVGERSAATGEGGASTSQNGLAYGLTTWVTGQPVRDWGQTDPSWLFGLGIALAKLHRALRSLPPDVAVHPVAAQGLGIPTPKDRALRGSPSDQVLHGDVTPGNVLDLRRGPAPADATDEEVSQRIGFIDFGRVSRGPVEWDLARALVSLPPWSRAPRPRESHWQAALALLRGYEVGGGEVRPERLAQGLHVAAAEGTAWAEEARLTGEARMRALAWAKRVATIVAADDGLTLGS